MESNCKVPGESIAILESWCCQCSVLSSDRPVEIERCRTERFYRTLKMVVKFNFEKKNARWNQQTVIQLCFLDCMTSVCDACKSKTFKCIASVHIVEFL